MCWVHGLTSQAYQFIHIMSQCEEDHGPFMIQHITLKIEGHVSRPVLIALYNVMFSA